MSGHLLVEPGDVAADVSDRLRMLYAHMIHSDKAFLGSTMGRDGRRLTTDMARHPVRGDLRDRYVCVGPDQQPHAAPL